MQLSETLRFSVALLLLLSGWEPRPTPVRIGVVGLVHGHVGWILGREDLQDVEVVGIAEADRELAQRFAERFGFDMGMVHSTVDEMLDATQPEAITVFSNIYDHLAATEAAAKRGVHVMVEKPLAVSLDHALQMKALADSAGIHLLTNYETTWYPTVHYTKNRLRDLGQLRKIVIRDGHEGPIEIGVGEEFSSWLLTEEKNGGGAIMDFGCYGANLSTWLMDGARPTSVTAVTQVFKEVPYGEVDDEATIILTYPDAQAIIQASWNWPFSRKDMSVYGTAGYIMADDAKRGRVRIGADPEAHFELDSEMTDPFVYLAGVVRGQIDPGNDLYSLPVNLVVMEILDAAVGSAKSGRTVLLDP